MLRFHIQVHLHQNFIIISNSTLDKININFSCRIFSLDSYLQKIFKIWSQIIYNESSEQHYSWQEIITELVSKRQLYKTTSYKIIFNTVALSLCSVIDVSPSLNPLQHFIFALVPCSWTNLSVLLALPLLCCQYISASQDISSVSRNSY